jgi:hypothetical protein
MKVCDLRSRLLKVDTYDSFYITYKNFKLNLIIKSIPEPIDPPRPPIGFELINDEILSPIAGENDLEVPSLRGWVLPYDKASFEADKEFTLEMFEVSLLMRGFDRTWIPTTEGAIQLVIDNLQNDKIPNSIGKILENRLLVNKTLPVSLITRHKDLELAHTN